MGEHVIKLPDVGEGIAEAELVEWQVKVGDLVKEDTTLGAVMTDKATVEIPSPVEGKVIWLGAEVGDVVAVGSPIVRLEVAGEGNATAGAPAPKATAAPAAAPASEAEDAAGRCGAGCRPEAAQRSRPPSRPLRARAAGSRPAAGLRAAPRGRQAAGLAGGAPAGARSRRRSAPGRRQRPGRADRPRGPRRLLRAWAAGRRVPRAWRCAAR